MPAHTMFKSLFRKPLQLQIGDQTLVFDSSEDLEFALSGRADVPGAHVAALMTMDTDGLRSEAAAIHAEEQSLVSYFGDVMSQLDELEQRFQAFQIDQVRTDHSWQDILHGLAQAPARYCELKRTAVIRYMQYLNTRARFIHDIVETRGQSSMPTPPLPESATESPSNLDSLDPALRSRLRAFATGQRTLALPPDQPRISLMLATNPFSIEREPTLHLDYDGTESWPLESGQTRVGRGDTCDITLHRLLKDISREHVVIDVDAERAVWITDTSTHGTYRVDDEQGTSE